MGLSQDSHGQQAVVVKTFLHVNDREHHLPLSCAGNLGVQHKREAQLRSGFATGLLGVVAIWMVVSR
jgi:hypothetical protein